ncbi:MAG: 7-cyano-7-deazaguanine synthase [Thermoplasmata archaeon]|jgi:7-cyano-7-deazaguanine synthase|nr:7-cyano-7-deazaguanine synthase [Thermoplasmata archaeon]
MRRALVLVSGGLDSTVALWWARQACSEVVPLTFHYPGRPRGEKKATREIAALAGLKPIEAELPFLHEAADVDASRKQARFAAAPPGYIPARNALFYAAACYQASVLGCEMVVGGHNAEDAARFPDASRAFFADLQALLHRGLWSGPGVPAPRLEMPLIGLDRDGVVTLGVGLGAPIDATWSCYEDGEGPCGACPACVRRGDLISRATA